MSLPEEVVVDARLGELCVPRPDDVAAMTLHHVLWTSCSKVLVHVGGVEYRAFPETDVAFGTYFFKVLLFER